MRPPILEYEQFTFRCTNQQTAAFVDELSAADKTKLASAARIAATSLAIGRPAANRWQKIRGSKGLFELKVTAPGSPGPQVRLICAVADSTVLLVHGLVKTQSALPAGAVKLAARELARWREYGFDTGER